MFKNDSDRFLFLLTSLQAAKYIIGATLEDQASMLCDKKKFAKGDIEFMQNLTLEHMAFSETKSPKQFLIRNTVTKTHMAFSNRNPGLGELRGIHLRNRLAALKVKEPQTTLYDALHKITTEKESDFHCKFKMAAKALGVDESTAGEFLDVLVMAASKTQNPVFDSAIMNNPEGLLFLVDENSPTHAKLNTIFDEFLFEKFIDRCSKKLNLLTEKTIELSDRGEVDAAYAACELNCTLQKSLETLIANANSHAAKKVPDQLHLKGFAFEYNEAINIAKTTLNESRGWKQFFADIAFLITTVLTLGTANLVSKKINNTYSFFNMKTESTKIVDNIEQELKSAPN